MTLMAGSKFQDRKLMIYIYETNPDKNHYYEVYWHHRLFTFQRTPMFLSSTGYKTGLEIEAMVREYQDQGYQTRYLYIR